MIRMIVLALMLSHAPVFAAKSKGEAKPNTKNHSFDSQVVEGEVYRPDYSVVTGEAPGEGWGVLRLRPNFEDHAVTDRAEKQTGEKKR